MTNNSGRPLTELQITKIVMLLTDTEIPIAQIAERMDCSRSAIASVNRRYGIRMYGGLKNRWTVHSGSKPPTRVTL